MTWWQQVKHFITLHPTKNENGDIVEVERGEALIYILSIVWILLSNICPPAHFVNGWATFFIALVMIGGITILLH